jgi:NADH-quinone oxidoreductase subunit M
MGIYPSSFTSFFDESVAAMVQHHHEQVSATTRFAQEMK